MYEEGVQNVWGNKWLYCVPPPMQPHPLILSIKSYNPTLFSRIFTTVKSMYERELREDHLPNLKSCHQ